MKNVLLQPATPQGKPIAASSRHTTKSTAVDGRTMTCVEEGPAWVRGLAVWLATLPQR